MIDWGIIGLFVSILAILISLILGPYIQTKIVYLTFVAERKHQQLDDFKNIIKSLLATRAKMTLYLRNSIDGKMKNSVENKNSATNEFNIKGAESLVQINSLALYLTAADFEKLWDKLYDFERACIEDERKENPTKEFWENLPSKSLGHKLDEFILELFHKTEKELAASLKPIFTWKFWKY